ncbi:MAG TPA: mechanosensitive ion channel [Spirochaetota bacterium]|nr:mechanosensitive ion channel [Spirochaetota bacterium]
MTASLTRYITLATGLSIESQTRIFTSLVILVSLIILRYIIIRIVWRQTDDVRTRYLWQKGLTYVMVTLLLVMVGRVWFSGFQSIATFLGLLSAGLVIALKDLIANIAGWAFILIRRTFTLGDRIEIGDHTGDVIDIRLFQFTIMEIGNWVDADQSTGRIIHLPNGIIFTRPLANYSKGFQYIWDEIPVTITFESNWKEAKRILQEIADRHSSEITERAQRALKEASKKFMIFYSKLTPIVYTDVKEHGVLLSIRYLSGPRNRRSRKETMWEDILEAFSTRDDIDFAYPTQRFFNHTVEGKQGGKNEVK